MNCLYAEPAAEEHDVGETLEDVGEGPKDVGEAPILGEPVDPTLLTSYATHVAAIIWWHKVMLLRLKILTY